MNIIVVVSTRLKVVGRSRPLFNGKIEVRKASALEPEVPEIPEVPEVALASVYLNQ